MKKSNQLKLSYRAMEAPASPIRKLVPYAQAAEKRGIKIYYLNIGDPDFEAPLKIRTTLQKLAKNFVRLPYAPSRGTPELLTAWQKYYHQLGIKLAQTEILVTTGGSEALLLAGATILNPDDEVLVFEPFYANYHGFINFVSGKVVTKATSKTKAIFFTNPNNPTGKIFSRQEIKAVLKLAQEHGLFVVSDETYRGLCFDRKKSWSLLEVATEKEAQRIIIVDSLSKRLNICGARLGAIISRNRYVMAAINKFAQTRLSVSTLDQSIAAPMLTQSLKYVKNLAKKYQNRRDIFLGVLEKELKIKITYPDGAFYALIKLPIKNAEVFARWLLTDFQDHGETVMVAPAAGFYATPGKGQQEVRVAFVLKEKALTRAGHLLALAVQKFDKTGLNVAW